jgi:hypothetical protein
MQFMVNYDRTFDSKHHVYALGLFNRSSTEAANSNAVYNFIPNNFQGYSGRVGYDYKNRYLVQFNVAYNGSDRFVRDKRFGLYQQYRQVGIFLKNLFTKTLFQNSWIC